MPFRNDGTKNAFERKRALNKILVVEWYLFQIVKLN